MESGKSLRPPKPPPHYHKDSLSGSTIEKVLTNDSASMGPEIKFKPRGQAGRGGAPPVKKEKEKKDKGRRESSRFFKISSLLGPSHRLEPEDNVPIPEEPINPWTQKPNESWSARSISNSEDSSTSGFVIDPLKLLEMEHGEAIVLKMISKDNAVNVFFFKNCFGNEKVKKKCIELITENFRETRETEDFQEGFRELGDRGGYGELLLELVNAL